MRGAPIRVMPDDTRARRWRPGFGAAIALADLVYRSSERISMYPATKANIWTLAHANTT